MGEELSARETILYVNGVRRVLSDGWAHLSLLQYLRDHIGLTGTKLSCGEGGCGACTVMASRYDRQQKRTTHYAINSCLAPLYSVEGMHVITVEGVGSCKTGLHPIQEKCRVVESVCNRLNLLLYIFSEEEPLQYFKVLERRITKISPFKTQYPCGSP